MAVEEEQTSAPALAEPAGAPVITYAPESPPTPVPAPAPDGAAAPPAPAQPVITSRPEFGIER